MIVPPPFRNSLFGFFIFVFSGTDTLQITDTKNDVENDFSFSVRCRHHLYFASEGSGALIMFAGMGARQIAKGKEEGKKV